MNELPPKPVEVPEPTSALWNGIKLVAWFSGFIAQFFPAIGYFADLAPPYFPQLAIFVSIAGAAVFIWSSQRQKARSDRALWGMICIFGAIAIVSVYFQFLNLCTEVPPRRRDDAPSRIQIGFGMHEWSLTEDARETIDQLASREGDPIEIRTPHQLMAIYGIVGGAGRVDEAWTMWSIHLAGSMLVVLFLIAVWLWAYGIGILCHLLTAR